MRETLQVVERMRGYMPEEGINPVAFPENVGHVWSWFLKLNRKRPQGMGGACAVPESEIYYFFSNRNIRPEPWEIDAIERLDFVALEASEKETE